MIEPLTPCLPYHFCPQIHIVRQIQYASEMWVDENSLTMLSVLLSSILSHKPFVDVDHFVAA